MMLLGVLRLWPYRGNQLSASCVFRSKNHVQDRARSKAFDVREAETGASEKLASR